MEIRIQPGDIAQSDAKAVIVNLFQGVTQPGGATGALDSAMGGAITQLIAEGEIKGKDGELTLVHSLGKLPSPRIIIAGLGKQDDFTLGKVRDVTANALRLARRSGAESVATVLHGAGQAGLDPVACAQAIAEGAIMGLYRFNRHKQPSEDERQVKELTVIERDESLIPALQKGIDRGRILAEAANHARDMANEPANCFTPTDMAARAQMLAQDAGIACEVLDRPEMESLGMGSLLSVANGSIQPPKFIIMRYRGNPGSSESLALIGKGITFDSGGISIKPAQGMEEMKADMSGGASVIAAIWALAKLGAPINVTSLVPATENMPSGSATKPGDIATAMNGKTVEIINTDAEGRLVLADAILYARQQGYQPIIDVATLTGAMSIALGPAATGFMATEDALAEKITRAGQTTGEMMWRLPLISEYREGLKSEVADIKNVGSRYGGAINAAEFIRFFVEDTPWVHIDMAGTDGSEKDSGVWVKGATGIPVRTLVGTVLAIAEEAATGEHAVAAS
ncbi:MAG TPA: leucyl aminopeptidase [Dehalococcoidia bacterium]|nr:leucyl aminopeptidase [Dehalococcoidia bacterium]